LELTHTDETCKKLFACTWKELDKNWLEECKESFKDVPEIQVMFLSEIKDRMPTYTNYCIKISPKLYVPKNEHYKTVLNLLR